MAKGNLLQGMARGKVGDLVFSRMDGEQITRVRNRNPRNPRTNKQLLQRAIMANVSALYSAGRDIFDHSFEGCSTPAENQRKFMAENVKILRSNLATDLRTNAPDNECLGRFAAPGTNGGVPFSNMLVSDGSLPNPWFPSGDGGFILPEPAANVVTQGDYARQLGLVSGDLFTFVCMVANYNAPLYSFDNSGNTFTNQYPMQFLWARVKVADLDTLTEPFVRNDVLHNIFLLDRANASFDTHAMFDGFFPGDNIEFYFFGQAFGIIDSFQNVSTCIRSKPDTNNRSKSYFKLIDDANEGFGLTSRYVLEAWKRGPIDVGDSDLILEGGDD